MSEAAREGPVPGIRGRSGDGLPDVTLSVSEWTGNGPTVGGRTDSTNGVKGLLSKDVGDSGVTRQGLQGGGKE